MTKVLPNSERCLPFLLAGGRGSRLFELTDAQCKPALPFGGGEGRIVDFILEAVSRASFGRLFVATQYQPQDLCSHLARHWAAHLPRGLTIADGSRLGAEGYLGTADALRRNIAAIDAHAPEEVMILSGDHILDIDLAALLAHHRSHAQPVTVAATAVPLHEAKGFGVFTTDDDGRATGFAEKPSRPEPMPGDSARALASTGIYVFEWELLRAMLLADPGALDFGHDILPSAMAASALNVYRLPDRAPGAGAYWRDVGTLEAYRKAWLDFLAPQSPVALPHTALKAALHRARATVDGSILLPGAEIGRRCLLNKVILAPGVHLPDGFTAGFDAEEDARWFRKGGDTLLITPDMLARREEERRPARRPTLRARLEAAQRPALGH